MGPDGKRNFIVWLNHIQMPDDNDWLIVRDFNLIRDPSNRNGDCGDVQEMFLFNDAISSLV
jgi:hypothetical protein